MRKAALLFIIVLAILTISEFTWPFSKERSDEDLFEELLNTSEMLTYQDPDFGFRVRYPSFFNIQPDSLDEYIGHVRFSFDYEWSSFVIESYVMLNHSLSIKVEMDSIARLLHATSKKIRNNYFILSGPQYEDGCYIEGYRFYSRFVSHRKLWYVYTMVYPYRYHKHLNRLFNEINTWKVYYNPQMTISRADKFILDAIRKGKKKKRASLNCDIH